MFAPESGREMLVVHNAHSMGVTASAGARDCKRNVSGGGEGQVRQDRLGKQAFATSLRQSLHTTPCTDYTVGP